MTFEQYLNELIALSIGEPESLKLNVMVMTQYDEAGGVQVKKPATIGYWEDGYYLDRNEIDEDDSFDESNLIVCLRAR